ncbi:hypothetical protein, partial [Idiomarina sp.]|uniref:hypothetical protein n=1 Tax=Idiomarina sp. TaxID=1874361 RepID=UPI00258E5212
MVLDDCCGFFLLMAAIIPMRTEKKIALRASKRFWLRYYCAVDFCCREKNAQYPKKCLSFVQRQTNV